MLTALFAVSAANADSDALPAFESTPLEKEFQIASEGVPSIFTESICFGDVKLPPKPKPMPPPGGGGDIDLLPIQPPPTDAECSVGAIENPLLGGGAWETPPGRKIFVSPSGSGSGVSESSPTTFSRALGMAGPGDAIIALPGTYSGMQITKGGTADRPLFIMASTPAVKISDGGVALAPEEKRSSFSGSILVLASNVVVDGVSFPKPNGFGISFNTPKITEHRTGGVIRNSVFYEKKYSISVYNGYHKIGFYNNYLYRYAIRRNEANPGGYGFQMFQSDPARSGFIGDQFDIQGNWFEGAWNHAIATKRNLYDVTIANNVVRGCIGYCFDIGSNVDGQVFHESTGGDLQIVRNCFKRAYPAPPNSADTAMRIDNHTVVTIANNQFYGYPTNIEVGFQTPGGDANDGYTLGQFGPVHPRHVSVINNYFKGGRLLFSGRGSPFTQTVQVQGNRGQVSSCVATPSRALQQNWGRSRIDVNFNPEKPRLTTSDNSFSCQP
ncbi:MAG: hypothetical protein U1E36_05395 [Rickettsiales bacterium]